MGLFGSKKVEVPVVEKNISAPEGTVIGQGITFVGQFTTDELIDIRGKVEGEIISPVEVLVSKTGKHEGTMDVEYLTVDGTIDSDIHCRNTVTLRDDCQVFGTVTTPKLDARDGSNFHGRLNLEKDLGKMAEADAEVEAKVETEKTKAEVKAEAENVKVEPKAEAKGEPTKKEPKAEPNKKAEKASELPTMEEVLDAKEFKVLEAMVAEQTEKPAKKATETAKSTKSNDNLVEFME